MVFAFTFSLVALPCLIQYRFYLSCKVMVQEVFFSSGRFNRKTKNTTCGTFTAWDRLSGFHFLRNWPHLDHKTRPVRCISRGRRGARATESAGLMRCTANSIPTAPTNLLYSERFIGAFDTNKAFDTNRVILKRYSSIRSDRFSTASRC